MQARGTDDEIIIRRTHKDRELWVKGIKDKDQAMDDVEYNTKNGHYGFMTRSVVTASDEITVTLEPWLAPSPTPLTNTWEEAKVQVVQLEGAQL